MTRIQPEDSIWAPASIFLVVDDVGDGTGDVHSGHALTKPLTLHFLWGHSPHLHQQITSFGMFETSSPLGSWEC